MKCEYLEITDEQMINIKKVLHEELGKGLISLYLKVLTSYYIKKEKTYKDIEFFDAIKEFYNVFTKAGIDRSWRIKTAEVITIIKEVK